MSSEGQQPSTIKKGRFLGLIPGDATPEEAGEAVRQILAMAEEKD